MIAAGVDRGDATCGVMDIAGISVGAEFVGAIAAVLVVGDLVRYLHEAQIST